MITKIELKNFKSFSNVELDLMKNKSVVKNMALIYGENGAGKSNIISSIYCLQSLFDTMLIRDDLQEMMQMLNEKDGEEKIPDRLLEQIRKALKTTKDIIAEYKTINSTKNMSIKLHFRLNDKNGVYYIELDNEKIVREKLEYLLNKNKGVYFDIDSNDIDSNDINSKSNLLNNNIICSQEYKNQLLGKIDKFWGKHSLMAILKNDLDDKSESFMLKNLSENFQRVLEFIFTINYKVKEGNSREVGKYTANNKIFKDIKSGKISKDRLNDLTNCEKMINDIFSKLYADIKKAYYKKVENGNYIEYELYFKKMISGELRDININIESTGTQQILRLIPFIITAIKGGIVLIDEFDSGIHDLMVRAILQNVNKYLQGQLILTTHNTKLMEEPEFIDYVYFLTIDRMGNKEICSINDYEKRTYRTNNVRDLYFRGSYEAIPYPVDIDYEKIISSFDI